MVDWIIILMLYATFNNGSAILWWSVLLVEGTRVPRDHQQYCWNVDSRFFFLTKIIRWNSWITNFWEVQRCDCWEVQRCDFWEVQRCDFWEVQRCDFLCITRAIVLLLSIFAPFCFLFFFKWNVQSMWTI